MVLSACASGRGVMLAGAMRCSSLGVPLDKWLSRPGRSFTRVLAARWECQRP